MAKRQLKLNNSLQRVWICETVQENLLYEADNEYKILTE